jgi:hypothetical protein
VQAEVRAECSQVNFKPARLRLFTAIEVYVIHQVGYQALPADKVRLIDILQVAAALSAHLLDHLHLPVVVAAQPDLEADNFSSLFM